MKRRQFIKTGLITSSLPFAGSFLWANSLNQKTKKLYLKRKLYIINWVKMKMMLIEKDGTLINQIYNTD